MSEVSLLTAVLAGALSFLSPCVLPLVPAYLGRISALNGGEPPVLHAALFVGGFASLFTILGLGAAYAGGALAGLLPAVQLPLGVAVIVGGLHLAGLVRIPLLDRGAAPRRPRGARGARALDGGGDRGRAVQAGRPVGRIGTGRAVWRVAHPGA